MRDVALACADRRLWRPVVFCMPFVCRRRASPWSKGKARRVANARLCTRRLQGRPPILQLELEVDDVFQPLFFLVHIQAHIDIKTMAMLTESPLCHVCMVALISKVCIVVGPSSDSSPLQVRLPLCLRRSSLSHSRSMQCTLRNEDYGYSGVYISSQAAAVWVACWT